MGLKHCTHWAFTVYAVNNLNTISIYVFTSLKFINLIRISFIIIIIILFSKMFYFVLFF